MKKTVRRILAVTIAVLAAIGAAAQVGGLKVAVRDPESAPLPGATVTISHELGYLKTTSELTDEQGLVHFPVLRPGRGYTIQISFPGFSPLRYDDIRANAPMFHPANRFDRSHFNPAGAALFTRAITEGFQRIAPTAR